MKFSRKQRSQFRSGGGVWGKDRDPWVGSNHKEIVSSVSPGKVIYTWKFRGYSLFFSPEPTMYVSERIKNISYHGSQGWVLKFPL